MGDRLAVERIGPDFFERHPVTCAVELIGAHFHWKGCVARIVETEAYQSEDDPACHTWFRPSARAFVERNRPGDAYVYLNYGVHWLFNVLAKGGSGEGFVLFRAVEPVEGIARMRKRRPGIADHLLGAGPGNLTRALGISGRDHGKGFLEKSDCGISRGEAVAHVAGVRIGISKAVELPWRFGDPESRALSRKF
jgi:DNA-3-methyladenine glycosylase